MSTKIGIDNSVTGERWEGVGKSHIHLRHAVQKSRAGPAYSNSSKLATRHGGRD